MWGVYPNDCASPRKALAGVSRYLAFYYHKRPHQALAYHTPAEVYFRPWANQDGVLARPVS
jgi:transposase InsO family protein